MNFDQNLKKTNSNTLVEKVSEKCAPPAQKYTIPFFWLKKTKNEKKSIEKACVVGVFRGQSLGGGACTIITQRLEKWEKNAPASDV